MSKSEELIGSFNPNDLGTVADIKSAAKTLIDTIMVHTPAGRRQAIALTHTEEAAMMAVKSLFEEK